MQFLSNKPIFYNTVNKLKTEMQNFLIHCAYRKFLNLNSKYNRFPYKVLNTRN